MKAEIDKSHLFDLVGEDADVVKPIVVDFGVTSIKLVAEMLDASKGKSFGEIKKKNLHQIKGSSGTLGMTSLYEMCIDLESKESLTHRELELLKECVRESVELVISSISG